MGPGFSRFILDWASHFFSCPPFSKQQKALEIIHDFIDKGGLTSRGLLLWKNETNKAFIHQSTSMIAVVWG